MQRKPAHPTLCSRAVNRGWDTSRHPSTFICSLAHKAARYATDASSDIISGVFICEVSLTPPFYFCSLVHKASMFATDASSPQSVLTRSRLKSGYITAFSTLFALSRIKQRGTQQTPTRLFSPKCGWISPRPTSVSEDIVGSVPHSNPNKGNQSLPQQKFVSCVSVCEKHTHITISLYFMHNTAMNSD